MTGERIRGPFLVLEGPEGAGKSTQSERLSRWLESLGLPCLRVREPGGTALGEAIRTHLWVRPELPVPPLAELFLLSAARHALVEEVVRPQLAQGVLVLADRFYLSTLAYQGYGRGVDLDTIAAVTRMATGGVEPDLTVVIDVSVDTGRSRQRLAGSEPDRIERESAQFMRRVRDGYRELAGADPRIVMVDGNESEDRLQERIRGLVRDRFPDWISQTRAERSEGQAG